jgi:hypothetical protein
MRLVRLCCSSLLVVVLATSGVGTFEAAPAGASPTGFVLMQVTRNIGGGTCQLGSVDLATGIVTPLPHVGADVCVSDLALTTDGRLFGLASNAGQPAGPIHLFQLDPTTGQRAADLGQVGTFNAFANPDSAGLAFDSSGALFVVMTGQDPGCAGGSPCLYRTSLANPSGAQFVGVGQPESLEGLAISCAGAGFTLTAPGVNAVLTGRSLSTGAVSSVGTGVGSSNVVAGLDFDSAGTLWGVGSTTGVAPVRHVFTLDLTTGLATVGAILTGSTGDPVSLGLPACSARPPPPAPPAAVVITPKFTG